MGKKIFVFLAAVFLLANFNFADAQEELEIYFFYGATCPHCAAEKAFLEDLAGRYEGVEVREFLVSENIDLLENYYQDYRVPEQVYGLVPITFTEERYFVGFSEEIGERMEECVKSGLEGGGSCDPVSISDLPEEVSTPIDAGEKVSLPFLGEISVGDYSLPVLTVVLGFFDGFNVCSLGALVLILSLVLALRDRKRIFALGGTFILTTAVIYGFLMVLWYRLFSLFAQYLRAMEMLIGLLAVAGGTYFLRQFIRYKRYGPTCGSGSGKGIVAKLSKSIQGSLTSRRGIVFTALAVLFFAAAVTIVEFPCSAAIPVLFAGILAEADLASFEHLLYIGVFVLFYMIDEVVIFLAAALTMSIKVISPRVLTCITLAASLTLFFLGFYYLFGFL